jgi:hypothetical protein
VTEWNIAPPPLTHYNIVSRIRSAPPLGEFDEAAALARMQRVQFLRSLHARGPVTDPALRAEWAAHQQRVATYAVVRAPAPPPLSAPTSPPTLAPLPAATVPRAPRPTVPAPVPPTPALAGITRRAEMLTSLLGARPTPVAPTGKNLV